MNNGRVVVAFDVDETLITQRFIKDADGLYHLVPGQDLQIPRDENVIAYKWFQRQGCYMIIWSSEGTTYARDWALRLDLVADEFPPKGYRQDVDISIDDSYVTLANVNLQVPRSKPWNDNV